MGRRRRINPFWGIVDHMSEMNRMREFAEGLWSGSQEDQQRTYATAWVPNADIYASGSDLVLRCELAGVHREDIEIALTGGVLTISGERRNDPSEQEVIFYTRESSYGIFRRTITLPEGIDDEDISAAFDNGLLQVVIKGGAAAVPESRRIEINDNPS